MLTVQHQTTLDCLDDAYPYIQENGLLNTPSILLVAVHDRQEQDQLTDLLNTPESDQGASWAREPGREVEVIQFEIPQGWVEDLLDVSTMYTHLLTKIVQPRLMITQDQLFFIRTPYTTFVLTWPRGAAAETKSASYTLQHLDTSVVVRQPFFDIDIVDRHTPTEQYITSVLLDNQPIQTTYVVLSAMTQQPAFTVSLKGVMCIPFPECVVVEHVSGSLLLMAPSKAVTLDDDGQFDLDAYWVGKEHAVVCIHPTTTLEALDIHTLMMMDGQGRVTLLNHRTLRHRTLSLDEAEKAGYKVVTLKTLETHFEQGKAVVEEVLTFEPVEE